MVHTNMRPHPMQVLIDITETNSFHIIQDTAACYLESQSPIRQGDETENLVHHVLSHVCVTNCLDTAWLRCHAAIGAYHSLKVEDIQKFLEEKRRF